jgi:hypothetical protein
MGVGLSCILCYVIIDVFGMGSVADLLQEGTKHGDGDGAFF